MGLSLCFIAYPYFLFSIYTDRRRVGIAMTVAFIGANLASLATGSPNVLVWFVFSFIWGIYVVIARVKTGDWPDPPIK